MAWLIRTSSSLIHRRILVSNASSQPILKMPSLDTPIIVVLGLVGCVSTSLGSAFSVYFSSVTELFRWSERVSVKGSPIKRKVDGDL